MMKWEETDPYMMITHAYPCDINWGIINKNWTCLDLPARVQFDDALMLVTDRAHMEMVLVAVIKVIFVMTGGGHTAVRQCPLAMDKWLELVIGPTHIIDTNKLTISIPYKYLNKVLDLLNMTWHPNRHCFKVSEAQKISGKLACLAAGANWVFHLLSHLYSLIAYALSKNRRLLTESFHKFQNVVEALQTGAFLIPCKDLVWHTMFAMKQVAKMMHHASY
jgi:hypothetical protein